MTGLKNKKVIYKTEIAPEEKLDFKFNKYETEEEKRKVEDDAIKFYNIIKNKKDKRYLKVLETALTSISYFYEVYDSCHEEQGQEVNDSDFVKKYHKSYNPYYYQIFVKKLYELGSKDGMFVSAKVNYQEEMGTYFLDVELIREKDFKDKYGLSLRHYYDVISKNIIARRTEEEQSFINEVENLKKIYIKFITKYDNHRFMEVDAYQVYLMIASKYKTLNNKDEILRELGFELDVENHSLKLIQNKELELSKNNL